MSESRTQAPGKSQFQTGRTKHIALSRMGFRGRGPDTNVHRTEVCPDQASDVPAAASGSGRTPPGRYRASLGARSIPRPTDTSPPTASIQ